MTRTIAVAAALLLGTVSLAQAQGAVDRGSSGSPGASQLSPGHEMRSGGDRDDRGPGASGLSPGHEMNERGTVGQSRGDSDADRDRGDRDRGASGFSPGDRMHDRNDVDRK